jgi:hypothetical protein
MTELEHKRKFRKKHTAECFTPPELVSEMLDRLPSEVFLDPTKNFLDNSAGDGAFLIQILQRKLANNHPPLQALSTIFGVELMPDNVEEMKQRLLDALPELDEDSKQEAKKIIDHNIVCADALHWNYDKWCPKAKAKSLF